jgi:hypothetical protein
MGEALRPGIFCYRPTNIDPAASMVIGHQNIHGHVAAAGFRPKVELIVAADCDGRANACGRVVAVVANRTSRCQVRGGQLCQPIFPHEGPLLERWKQMRAVASVRSVPVGATLFVEGSDKKSGIVPSASPIILLQELGAVAIKIEGIFDAIRIRTSMRNKEERNGLTGRVE